MAVAFDGRAFRQVAGQFATGVTVIAMELDGTIRAMTANSFTTLSLDPPLVLFCPGKNTTTGKQIHAIRGFSVNILREEQQDLSSFFAGLWKGVGPPYSFLQWEGGPRLEGSLAAMGCQVHAIHEGGDHWIVVGRVVALHRAESPCRPLVFFGGRYAELGAAHRTSDELPLIIAWSGPSG